MSMEQEGIVSVIIPVYNVEAYIERCLKSIMNQSYNKLEIICIDDRGSDNSCEIIEKYMQQDSRIILYHNENNIGLGASRDKGLKLCTGEYVTFVDSDDYIKKDYIERYYKETTNNNLDVVIGGYTHKNGKAKKIHRVADNDLAVINFDTSCAKLYRTDFLRDNHLNFRGIRRYEDGLFTMSLMLCSPKYKVIDYFGYYYVMNPHSITRENKNRSTLYFEFSGELKKYLQDKWKAIPQEKTDIFCYTFSVKLIVNALYNGRGSNMQTIKKIHSDCFELIHKYNKKHLRNPYNTLINKWNMDSKTHYVVWLVMFAHRLHFSKGLFMLTGLI